MKAAEGVVEGVFAEREHHPHRSLRSAVLAGSARHPAVEAAGPRDRPVEQHAKDARTALADRGVFVRQLERTFTSEELVAFGNRLGSPMRELHSSVSQYVELECVLNLRNDHGDDASTEMQPFSTAPLTLHSESSGRPRAQQPRHIVLMCCEPGDLDGDAETLLVSMTAVSQLLTTRERQVLSLTKYRAASVEDMILRTESDRPVFAFRDFGPEALEWTCDDRSRTPEDVNMALASLLEAMYASPIQAVRWAPGLLVVIDNWRYFHGRTAGAPREVASPRHLKRLRLLTSCRD